MEGEEEGGKGRKREGRGGRGREREEEGGKGRREGRGEEEGRGGALIRIFCVNIEDSRAIYMRTYTRPIGRQRVGAFKCAVTTLFTSYSVVYVKLLVKVFHFHPMSLTLSTHPAYT